MKLPVALILSALVAAGTAVAGESAPASKPDPAKGALLATPCQACHMADGSRGQPQFPILQGQQPEYIIKQLTEFKAGKRVNPIMTGMAATVADGDMKDIAAFYSAKKAAPGTPPAKEIIALGQQIWRGGILARQVPACAGCHGPNGAGIPSQYPRVGGQHTEYAEAQLIAFRSGARANSAQMTAIAGKLNDREIKALADYVASLR
jgi:cytochrome c553